MFNGRNVRRLKRDAIVTFHSFQRGRCFNPGDDIFNRILVEIDLTVTEPAFSVHRVGLRDMEFVESQCFGTNLVMSIRQRGGLNIGEKHFREILATVNNCLQARKQAIYDRTEGPQ